MENNNMLNEASLTEKQLSLLNEEFRPVEDSVCSDDGQSSWSNSLEDTAHKTFQNLCDLEQYSEGILKEYPSVQGSLKKAKLQIQNFHNALRKLATVKALNLSNNCTTKETTSLWPQIQGGKCLLVKWIKQMQNFTSSKVDFC